jgi:hypothetical protein
VYTDPPDINRFIDGLVVERWSSVDHHEIVRLLAEPAGEEAP